MLFCPNIWYTRKNLCMVSIQVNNAFILAAEIVNCIKSKQMKYI
jgi:hypothetical protein